MTHVALRLVEAVDQLAKVFCYFRMPDGFTAVVGQQVLFGNVREVRRFGVFRKKMLIGLIFARPHLLWYRQPPFLGVVEGGVDIKNDAPKRKQAVADNLADPEFGSAGDVGHI